MTTTPSIRYNRRNVFNFEAAVACGYVTDSDGKQHRVIAHGTEFLITQCDGREFCFNRRGIQFADHRTIKLTLPAQCLVELPTYLVYNTATMQVVSQHDWAGEGYDAAQALGDGFVCINTTHRLHKDTLVALGVERSWYEAAL